MKNNGLLKHILVYLPIFSLLFSCSNIQNPPLDEYVNEVEYKQDFKILNLTDIHLTTLTNIDREFNYLKDVINAPSKLNLIDNNLKPDLIVLNGDIFLGANKDIVKSFFRFIDSFDIPFAYTYGNHDIEGSYSESYIDNVLKDCKNSLLLNPKDNIEGNCNYVVNLVDANDNIKWQLYFFDSHSYYPGGYNVISDNQIQWYESQVKAVGNDIPSLAFFHIPFEEFDEVWREKDKTLNGYDGESYWHMGDKEVSYGYRENELFEKMDELGSTKGVIVGHNHENATNFYYSKNGGNTIRLIFALKTGDQLYNDDDFMGGTLLTLHDGDTFSLNFIHQGYGDEPYLLNKENFKDGDFR